MLIKTNTYKFLLILLLPFLFFQCNSNDKKITKVTEIEYPNSMDSLGVISYHLNKSNYVIKMRLSGIKTEKVENAFSIKEDDYSVPVKKDGYLLTLNFRINNPSEKELMIPIPNYFSVSNGTEKFFSEKPLFSKSCYCEIIGSSEITNLDEKNYMKYRMENAETQDIV